MSVGSFRCSVFSCNLQKTQPPLDPLDPLGPPAPPAPGATAKWNNETVKDTAVAAARDSRDFKRVHFSLETLNTRRLLARMATSDDKRGGARREAEGALKLRAGPNSRLCENGGPAASFTGLLLPLPSSSCSAQTSTRRPTAVAPPPVATSAPPVPDTTPPVPAAPPPASVDPPQPGELQELQEQIDEMREKLRTALARRAEIQTTLVKPVATVTNNLSQVTTTTTTTGAPTTTLPTLPTNTKCVTTMTAPPHKVLSKVRPLPRRLSSQNS